MQEIRRAGVGVDWGGGAYTKVGRLAVLIYPDGNVDDSVRDSQGRISQIGLVETAQLQRATEAGIHYSVANGRRNRAAASMSKAGIIRGGAKFLGPLGAFVNYRENFNKCQCQAK